MSDALKKIKAAREAYNDASKKIAEAAKADKKIEAQVLDEVKKEVKRRLGKRESERESLRTLKRNASIELTQAIAEREKEIADGISAGSIDRDDARQELIELGHTEASANILIGKALKEPASTDAPGPLSAVTTAPLPPKENPPADEAPGEPISIDDPISAAIPDSRTVEYKDSSPKK